MDHESMSDYEVTDCNMYIRNNVLQGRYFIRTSSIQKNFIVTPVAERLNKGKKKKRKKSSKF